MADIRARIEVEDLLTGDWVTVAVARDEADANSKVDALKAAGLEAVASCGCGSYEYGICPLCNDPETEASTTIDHLLQETRPIDSCRKCGKALTPENLDAYTDMGEGEEAGKVFVYCSAHCRDTH